jgi:hypothetical protein
VIRALEPGHGLGSRGADEQEYWDADAAAMVTIAERRSCGWRFGLVCKEEILLVTVGCRGGWMTNEEPEPDGRGRAGRIGLTDVCALSQQQLRTAPAFRLQQAFGLQISVGSPL